MTDQTAHIGAWTPPREDAVQLPAPVPFSAPVLIGDCATPLAGETLLSLLWRRLDAGKQE